MSDRAPARIGFIAARQPGAASSGMAAEVIAVQAASPADTAAVVAVVAEAFLHDPTWSWAFPDPALRRRFWEACVAGALRYPWVFKTSGFEAVSVWIPPHGTEFSHAAEERLPELLDELAGARAPDVVELLNRFDQAHPRQTPHYYLSLLATADAQRGRGLGMALFAENLARIDAAHQPAYLESSNPINNRRYEAVGFVAVATFQAPGDGPVVTGMWREAR